MTDGSRHWAAVLGVAAAFLATAASADAASSALMANGDAVVWRHFSQADRDERPPDLVGLAAVTADGHIDTAFGRNGFSLERASSPSAGDVAVDSAGDIVVIAGGALQRFDSQGNMIAKPVAVEVPGEQLDATDLLALPDRRLLVAGILSDGGNSGANTLALIRLLPDGSIDPSFGDNGVARAPDGPPVAGPSAVVRRLDGGGFIARGDGVVARFDADGAPDESFGGDGAVELPSDGPVAPAGDGYVVGMSDAGDFGFTVERLNHAGLPDTTWGDGGSFHLPGQRHDENGEGEQIVYHPNDLLTRDDGSVLVGLTGSHDPGSDESGPTACTYTEGDPVLIAPGGATFTRLDPYRPAAAHLLPTADGGVFMTGDGSELFLCGWEAGYWDFSGVAKYDSQLKLAASVRVLPQGMPPSASILSGPPIDESDDGDPATFTFEATPGPYDKGDVVLRCALDAELWQPCPADGRYSGLADGTHTLHVRALGINGAPSDTQTWTWTVKHPQPPLAQGEATTLPAATLHAPVLSGATETSRRWRLGTDLARASGAHRPPVGTTFRFDLDVAATVHMTFRRARPGARSGARCVKRTHRNTGARRCTRWLRAGKLAFAGHAGINSLHFEGRLSAKRTLRPGRYRVVIAATSASGMRSKAMRLGFRIVR